MFVAVFVFSPCFRQIAMVDSTMARSSGAGWSTRLARSRHLGSRMKACGPLNHAPGSQEPWRPLAEPPPLSVQILPIPNRRALLATSPTLSGGATWRSVTNNAVVRLTLASNPRSSGCIPISALLRAG
jgi:hypothetical protein